MYHKNIAFGLLAAGGLTWGAHPAFGCRIEGVMGPAQATPAVQQEQDSFLWSSLVSDSNSLQRESAKRPPKNGVQDTYDIEDLSGVLRKSGNPDGWGMASYPAFVPGVQAPVVAKSILPAYADTNYTMAVSEAIRQKPNIMLAHVRLASPECKEIQLVNVHPFTFQNWSFIHNGTVTGALSPAVEAKINQYRPILGGGPKGNTDSERVFYYFLCKLYEATGTTDSRRVPLPQIERVFAQSINELITASKHPSKTIGGDVMGIEGELQVQPACNFILSDGVHLLAFKKIFDLFVGQKTLSNNQKAYVIASEKRMNDPSISWLEMPEDHVLTIAWDNAGNPKPHISPLSKLIEPAPLPPPAPAPIQPPLRQTPFMQSPTRSRL